MQIQRPRPGTLQLKKSRANAALHVAFLTLFFGTWYSLLLAGNDTFEETSTFFTLLFWLVPLFALPDVLRQLRVLTSGETFTLNRDTSLIERNGVRLAHFSDVERVQIRTIYDSEGSNEYRLSIVLKTEDKIRIDQSTNAQEIGAAAEDIADMLGVDVTRKGGGAQRLSFGLGDD